MKYLSIPSLIFAAIFALSAQNYAGSTLVQAFSVGLGFPRTASCGIRVTATCTSTALNAEPETMSNDVLEDLELEAQRTLDSLVELNAHLPGKTAATADWNSVDATLDETEQLHTNMVAAAGLLPPLSLITIQIVQLAGNIHDETVAARAAETNQNVPQLLVHTTILQADVNELVLATGNTTKLG